MKNLEFRRQYLLTNLKVDIINNWKHLEIERISKPNFNVYYHPDLEVFQQQIDGRSLVLLGYMLDPYNPERTNQDIVNHLINSETSKELFEKCAKLSGRYALVYCNVNESIMVHDATGFREIFYSKLDNGDIFCGSTPNIINKYANNPDDNDSSLQEFMQSAAYRQTGFWVGNKTPIRNIFHLLPNFFLNLESMNHFRYWPVIARKRIGLGDGAEKLAEILKGTMLAATKRYELHQGLTCGFDTRVLLAGSKDVLDRIKFVTHKGKRLSEKNADIYVPRQMAEKFKLNHEVIDLSTIHVDEKFTDIYSNNNVFARTWHIPIYYNVYKNGLDKTYWVTGSFGNEILRLSYPLVKKDIKARDIAKAFNYDKSNFVIKAIDEWLSEAKPVYDKCGYDIINMFFYEHYVGNWVSLGGSEGNIAREELHPFNCRDFIITYLSFDKKYRYKDNPQGHLMIVRKLWPELLKFNTVPFTNPLNVFVKKTLRLLRMEILVDRLYYYLKSL